MADPNQKSVENTSVGELNQESKQAENTIVTRDKGEQVSTFYPEGGQQEAVYVTSTEKAHCFESIMNRWMPMKAFSVNTDKKQNETVAEYYIPKDLITNDACAANILAFQQFTYGRFELEMLFKVNANKFQQGRLIAYVTPDPCNMKERSNDAAAGVTRQHVWLDLSGSNQATLAVGWAFHRPMMRVAKKDNICLGVCSGIYCVVRVKVTSPLLIVEGQNATVTITPFFRFREAQFTAMAPARPQMMSLENLWRIADTTVKIGNIVRNMDKPTLTINKLEVVPRPRLFFTHGKGLSDAVPLRLDPRSTTTFRPDHARIMVDDSVISVARIWGWATSFTWSVNDEAEKLLFTTKINPPNFASAVNSDAVFTPFEYICNNFMFWRGTIEVRLDFVSTAFHTGTLLLSSEYGQVATPSLCNSASTYTKYFDLGEQKTVTFTIPYIYDTVWRRMRNVPFTAEYARNDRADVYNSAVLPHIMSQFNVRVINKLRAVSSVSPSINILMFIRAGEDFEVCGLCQNNIMVKQVLNQEIHQFPYDYKKKTQKKTRPVEYEMDTEFRENADSTADFKCGPRLSSVQTTESQISIKDIMRRPIKILHNAKVSASYSETTGHNAYFIPCMPPNYDYARVEGAGGVDPAVLASPQTALSCLFRFWRGSLRYTIVLNTATAAPVYIYHVPKSGIVISGNSSYPFHKSYVKDSSKVFPSFSLGATGLACDILIPTINTSAVVEVPFLTDVDWCIMHNGDAGTYGINVDTPWRDRADDNIGHLAIECINAVTMDVWVAAGDDFEMAGWLGTPTGRRYTDLSVCTDNSALPQGLPEFISGGVVERGVEWLANGGAKTIAPVVAATVGLGVTGLGMNRVGKTLASIEETSSEIRAATIKISETIEETNTEVLKPSAEVVKQILDVLSPLSGLLNVNTLALVVIEIFQSWQAASWKAVAMSFVKILLLAGLVNLQHLSSVASSLTSLIESRTSVQPNVSNLAANFSGVLLAAVAAALGVATGRETGNYARRFTLEFLSVRSFSMVTHATRFIKEVFDEVKWAVYKVCGWSNPEAEILQLLSEKNIFMKNFVDDAQKFLLECNRDALISNPANKSKFWITVCNAMQINKKLMSCPEKRVSPLLMNLCRDVISKANEEHIMLSNCPVRYEPFVICVEGPTNVGKSFMTDTVAVELMKAIGLTSISGEIVYVKNPGPSFWNGYRNQPVINFDEFLNIGHPDYCAQQISDLYTLKSTAIFNPNMAALNVKEIRGNPLVVIINCNNAFPELPTMPHPEAIIRRRDLVVTVKPKEQYVGVSPRKVAPQVRDKFGHLEFYVHGVVTKPSPKEAMEYGEYIEYLKDTFVAYHKQEQANVKVRISKFAEVMGDRCHLAPDLVDPFTLYYQTLMTMDLDDTMPYQTAMPSDLLTFYADQISRHLDSISDDPPEVEAQAEVLPPTIHELLDVMCYQRVSESGECVVCKNPAAQIIKKCRNSTSDCVHSVCSYCYTRMVHSANVVNTSCPLCRGDLQDIPESGMLAWLKRTARVFGYGVKRLLLAIFQDGLNMLRTLDFAIEYMDVLTAIFLYLIVSSHSPLAAARTLAPTFVPLALLKSVNYLTLYTPSQYLYDTYDSLSTVALKYMESPPPPDAQADEEPASVGAAPIMACVHTQYLPSRTYFRLGDDNREYMCMVVDEVEQVEQLFEPCGATCWLGNARQRDHFLSSWRVLNRHTIETLERTQMVSVNFHIPGSLRPQTRGRLLQLLDSLSSLWQTYITGPCKTAWDFVAKHFGKIIALLVGIGGLASIISYVRSPSVEEPAEFHSPSQQYRAQVGDMVRVNRGLGWRVEPIVEPQSQETAVAAVNDITSNFGHIVIVGLGRKEVWLAFTGWYGKYAFINEHYMSVLAEYRAKEYEMYLRPIHQPQVKIPWTFQKQDFRKTAVSDLLVFRTPPQYPIFKDLRKKIANLDDLTNRCLNRDCLMVEVPAIDGIRSVTVREVVVQAVLPHKQVTGYNGKTYTIFDVIKHNYSRKGACGSLIISPNLDRPIVGIHAAGVGTGTNGEGYALCLLQELFEEFEPDFEYEVVGQAQPDWETINTGKFHLMPEKAGNLMEVNNVKKGCHVPSKSRIEPSLIAEFLPPPQTAVVALSSKDPRWNHPETPLAFAVNEQGVMLQNIPPIALEKAKMWLSARFSQNRSRRAQVSVLTPEQAIRGFEGMEYYDAIDLNTSAGWPWVNKARRSTKHPWIVNGSPVPELRNEIHRKIDNWSKGILNNVVFMDILKDERRSKLNPRLISGAPVDYLVATRMYTLDFVAAIMNNKINNWIGVGINPDGPDWTHLRSKLTDINPTRVVAFDYKAFGPTLSSQAVQVFIEVVVSWYQQNSNYDAAELRCLVSILTENMNSLHLASDLIYQTLGGSPSGSPITVIVNSIVNLVYLIVAWVDIVGESVTTFYENVYGIVYGDDGGLAVSEQYLPIYNGTTIQQALGKYGIVLTGPRKEVVVPASYPIEDFTFLKRKFVPHPTRPGMYLAPVEWKSVEDCAKFIHKTDHKADATNVNAAMSSLLAFGHGEKKYNSWVSQLNVALAKARIPTITTTWKELDHRVFDNNEKLVMDILLNV